jgi:tryptophan synthase alpha chain
MTRVAEVFARARGESRCALIPFLVAGDPNAEVSNAILQAVAESGADLIELGVPYSDPFGDGPTIVAASQRALEAGADMDSAIELAAKSPVPVILFTYANPVMRYGVERLAERLAAASACGLIIPDLPLEEARNISPVLARHGLVMPLLVAPTTPPERARRIVAESSGFVYLVARLGVTGAGDRLRTAEIEAQILQLRAWTTLPIAIGFGISQRGHVSAMNRLADGVIVGSALIDAYSVRTQPEQARAAGAFTAKLFAGTEWENV